MSVEFPISSSALLSVLGLAFFIAVCVEIAKLFVEDRRWLNVVALAVGLVVALVAVFVNHLGRPDAEAIFQAVIGAVFAIGVATFGYEMVTRLAGLVGYGPQSDQGRIDAAVKQIAGAGLHVVKNRDFEHG